jgi:hypothetical protein
MAFIAMLDEDGSNLRFKELEPLKLNSVLGKPGRAHEKQNRD